MSKGNNSEVESHGNRELNERYQLLVSHAPICIHEIDLNGRLTFMNPAGLALMGTTMDQVLGCQYLDFVNLQDRDHVRQLLERAMQGQSFEFEFSFEFKGTERSFSSSFVPISDAEGKIHRIMGITQDLTERVKAENQLFEEKERAQVTLYSIGDAVISTDAKGNIDFLNQVAEKLIGWSSQDARGKPLPDIFQIIDENNREPLPNPVDLCLKTGQPVNIDESVLLVNRHGEEFSIEDSAAPIRNQRNEILGVVLVFKDVTESRNLSRKINYQASHDALTGLINRAEFDRRLERVLQTAKQNSTKNALCYLDLDQFKLINDTSGHVAGDQLMRELGHLLRAHIRTRDTLARLGGDEFGLLIEHCSLQKAQRVANDLITAITNFSFEWEGRNFRIGVSVGLVEINQQSQSVTEILSAADTACYMAKERGGSRLHVYSQLDEEFAQRHGEMQWASRLPKALEEDLFQLYYQPIVATGENNAKTSAHYEILLRMQDEKGKLITPGVFLPAAERYRLSSEIDRWVVSKTLKLLSNSNNHDHLEQLELCAINLSGLSLCDNSFTSFLMEELRQSSIPNTKICFEITETAAIANIGKARSFINTFKKLGCTFALDDFGSGLSSFAYLKNLPVDYLKIDGLFVQDILRDPTDFALVKSINEIGHVMGKKTIAEFVENSTIQEKMGEIGVDFCQGFSICHPKPLTELLDAGSD